MVQSKTTIYDVEELKRTALETGNLIRKVKNPQMLISSMEKLFEQAMAMKKIRDYSMTYVYLLRYMDTFTALQRLPDFGNHKKYYELIMGQNVKNALLMLEELDNLFRQSQTPSVNESSQSLVNTPSDVTGSSHYVTVNSENEKFSNQTENIAESINGSRNKYSAESPYISSDELFVIIKNRKSSNYTILILDLRPKGDFNASRMQVDDIINIPEEKIVPGLTPNRVEKECLKEEDVAYFRKRKEYDWVILVDWCSKVVNDNRDVPINEIMTILTKWDINRSYKRNPVILVGGYEEWWFKYPTLTTDPAISPPRPSKSDTQFLIDSIKYNSLDFYSDVLKTEKKSEVTITNTNRPLIDRSTKPGYADVKKDEATSILDKEELPSQDDTKSKDEVNLVDEANSINKKNVENRISDNCDTKDDANVDVKGYQPTHGSTDDENQEFQRIDNGEDISDDEEKEIDETNDTFYTGISHNLNEYVTGFKRSSSIPDVSKLNVNETKPRIDRSTKPSIDDQSNLYIVGYRNDIGKGLTGLKNLGNTCYMNSIIQCLSNTELLRQKLCSLDVQLGNEESKTRGHVARALRSILIQLWSGETGAVSCKELKIITGEYRDTFRGYDQQDSHEFLTILIDWLHEDLKDKPKHVVLDGANESTGEKAWGEFISKNNSIVRQLFYGQLKSTVRCNVCKKESVTFEPFSNLSLPLPSEEKCTLAECLKLYINNENIQGWQCPGCKTSRDATKRLDITRLPPLLVIHFKRFTSGGYSRKRLTNVDFPNVLDMEPFIIGDEHRNRRYLLYAISNHFGTMESGHYTACCLNSPSQKWYKFDDQEVTSLPALQKSSSAYIVFYQSIKH